jgi:hypothetical protein
VGWDDPGCVSVHELRDDPGAYPWWPGGAIFCGIHGQYAYYKQAPDWVPPPPAPPPPPPPPGPPPPADCTPSSQILADPSAYPWWPDDAFYCGWFNGEAYYKQLAGVGGVLPPPAEDLDPWAGELGDAPTDQQNDDWDDDYDQETSGLQTFAMFSGHPAPGTIIGTPGCGTHSPPASCSLHSLSVAAGCAAGDAPCNWQSCNAVDMWLFPGTAIVAPGKGHVSAQYGYGLMDGGGGRFAGYRLHFQLDSGALLFMTHMRELHARPGARLNKGGLLGWSGIANGVPHLHLGASIPYRPIDYARKCVDFARHRRRRPPHFEPGPPPDFFADGIEQVKARWHDLQYAYGRDRHAANVALRDLADRVGGEVR